MVDDKPVVIIKVYKGSFTPYYYNNKAYKRSDTATVEVDKNELDRLIREGQNFSYEELEANEQELEFTYLERIFRQKKMIGGITPDILKSLELVRNNRYINAAVLLSDRNPLKNSTLALIKYARDLMNIEDRQILNCMSIIEQFDRSIEFYRKHISVNEYIKGAYKETVEEVPLVAYREALTKRAVIVNNIRL